MGFFSKIRKRIKKIIPKEIRPFVPYIAAAMVGPAGIGGLGQTASRFMTAAAARAASDDEANLKDIARAGGLAALPSALSEYGGTEMIGSQYAKTAGDYIQKQGTLKTLGAQGAVDMGIKAAELNEEALERYNRELAEQGIADKAGRRAAIRAIYEGTGTWDMDEVDDMLDTYGYRIGGRVGFKKGSKKKDFEESDFYNSFKYAKQGLESLEEAEDEIKPLPIRELRLSRGGDVDDDVMEFDEEIITPEYLMREEGVKIEPQVSEPSRADELNSLSMDLFGKPLGDLTEIEMEMLMNFASQQASGYSQEELDMYDQYKYDMNEQKPGMPIMSIDEYLQMELGAARMGVKKGGIIQLMPQGVIYKGKAKDYPGIKQLIKDAKKKGKRKGKADGGLMDLGGNEMDLRGGGFVPMGAEERADDVPARLSKNEFVMTADAVRAAGGGSVQKGADLMYNQMKQLEARS